MLINGWNPVLWTRCAMPQRHLRAAVCYFNTSLSFNPNVPPSLSLAVEFITPVAQLDLSRRSHNNVSPQTSNSDCVLVLIHQLSDSSGGREIKTAVTQMNWTRRTIRMKNKKLFCFFVTYPTVVTLRKPSRPHVAVSCTWIKLGLTLAMLKRKRQL